LVQKTTVARSWPNFRRYKQLFNKIQRKKTTPGLMANIMQKKIFPCRLSSQLNVFIKSIISHPFLKHFNRKNSICKILTTLSYRLLQIEDASLCVINNCLWMGGGRGGNLQTDAAQLFLFDPIPAKVKKFSRLSNYKFSLIKVIHSFRLQSWKNPQLKPIPVVKMSLQQGFGSVRYSFDTDPEF
jgi:hypothetical protein